MGNDAVIKVGGDVHDLIDQLKQATSAINALTSQVAAANDGAGKAAAPTGGLGSLFGTLVGGVTSANLLTKGISALFDGLMSIPRGIAGVIGSSIQMNSTLETSTLQFATLMGNADKAKSHVEFLFDFAKKTPFETGPIIKASKDLEVFGGAALNTQKNLTLVGDAAAATGAPINEVAMWTGRLYAALQAGKPFGEAAQRLGELGVMGPKARAELEKMQKSGADGTEIFAKYQDQLGKFTGAMAAQANTWEGLTSSISDAFGILSAQAFAPFFDAAKKGLQLVLDLLGDKGVEGSVKRFGSGAAVAFKIAGDALSPLLQLLVGGAKGMAQMSDSGKTNEAVVRGFITVISYMTDALAMVVRAVATVIQAYYEFRIAGNLLLIAFGTVVETVLKGAINIANSFAKISFGETRKSFERDAEALGSKLTEVQKDVSGLKNETEDYRKKSEAVGASMRGFADKMNVAAQSMRDKAAAYKYVEPAAAKYVDTVKDLGDTTDKAAGKQTTLEKAQISFGKQLADLETKIRTQIAAGKSMAEIIALFGDNVKTATEKAGEFGMKVPQNIAAVKQAIIDGKFDEAYRKTMGQIEDINQKEWDRVAKDTEAGVKKAGESYKGMKDVVEKASDEAALAQKKGLDKQLAQLDIKHREEIQKLGTLPPAYATAYEAAKVNVDAKYKAMSAGRDADMAKEIADLAKIGPTYGASYEKAKQAIEEKYRVMSALAEKRRIDEIAGLGPIPDEYRKAYDAAVKVIDDSYKKLGGEARTEDAKKVRAAWLGGITDVAKSLADLSQIAGGTFGNITAGVATMVGSMSAGLKSIDAAKAGMSSLGAGNILQGITGLATGIGGVLTAATAAWSGLKKLFGGKEEWKKIADDVSSEFGFSLSEGLAKEIEKIAKTIKGGTAAQRRDIAETLSLAKIIDEAGGLNASNTDKYIAKAFDLFAIIKSGGAQASQATATLNDVIGKFGAEIVKSGGLASDQFLKLIAQAKQTGVEMANVTAFLDQQYTKLTGGVTSMVKGTITSITQMSDDYTKALTATLAKGDANYKLSAAEQLAVTTKNNENIRNNFQSEFDNVSRITLASFNAMIAQGKTAGDAINALGGPIDQLIEASKKFGLQGSASFDQLARWRDLVKVNQDVISSVGGLNDIMVALYNTGSLDAATFKDLQTQAVTSFTKMTESGFTAQEATAQMRPLLQTIISMQREHGMVIDESTQKMLDEARASGVLGDVHVSAQDRMAQATERVAGAIEYMAGKMGYVAAVTDDVANRVAGQAGRMRGDVMSVGDAADNTTGRIRATPWEEYAARGTGAAVTVRGQLYSIPQAVNDVSDNLYRSRYAFDEWSRYAVDRAENVRDEIDGISFGSSPGGIKEWLPMLRNAAGGFREFEGHAKSALEAVRNNVDRVGLQSDLGVTIKQAGRITTSKSITMPVTIPQGVIASPASMDWFISTIEQKLTTRLGRDVDVYLEG